MKFTTTHIKIGVITFFVLIFSHIAFSQSENKVKSLLSDYYGDYYNQYVGSNENIIEAYTKFYELCEIIHLEDAPNEIPNISSLRLKNKYNPKSQKELINVDAQTFNVFRYSIVPSQERDLYYRIYNTNLVLKVRKI